MATLTQPEITITRDVIYKREPDHDLPLDIYEPASYSATLVDIHGGGWFHGDKAKDEDLATRLAQSGFRVVVLNYRLTPDYHFLAGVDDVLDVGVQSVVHVIPGTQHAKGYMDVAYDSSVAFLKRTLDA